MITLTGFADEISSELDIQLDVLESEQIHHLELRSVWGKNVLQLTDDEAVKVKRILEDRGFQVSSIGSPLGKIKITDNFDLHLEEARKAIWLASFFQVSYVRIFSFYIPDGEHDRYRSEVLSRMQSLVHLAERAGIVLLHENESHIYGDNGERCRDLLQAISSPYLRAAFDPANFVQCKVSPVSEAYPLLDEYISYIHIKDAVMETGSVVPSGEGDGQLRQLLQVLKQKGYCGYMSLEPHLQAAGRLEGLSKPELFIVASRAIKLLLAEQNIPWS
ncbi:Sugar phosphate isomerase/epimerase [Paenibacillus catalpae]|uniref:Sugar phosphate isomerase/epimerase n=1 Tax=Paenibacillus catalpae TaxID=1045775 RepID=A0A1I1T3K0_9BACL|nr:sugar phosphate isomerase/epimerase family protein [Paenibacillus catalpae]SFD49890.1 Sugar phosphate isomerase/epimerase [Paenibacillus catalpae]